MNLLSLLLLASSLVAWDDGPKTSTVIDVSDALEAIRTEKDVPALMAMGFRNGQMVVSGHSGLRSMDREDPVTIADPFHLGSCGKAMTSTLAAVLIERGEISWDTTIPDALPGLAEDLHPYFREVTLEMLLRHRGGIAERRNPELGALLGKQTDKEGTPAEQRRAFLRLVLAQKPTTDPGKSTEYSNYGYMTAAAMMEDVTGMSWEELIVEEVFGPLGMKSAGVGSPVGSEVPVGHQKVDGRWKALDPGPDGLLPWAISPAGLEHCSLADWARFLQEHVNGERGVDGLVSAETYQRLHDNSDNSGYACGWSVSTRPWAKGMTLSHNGSDGTWFSVVWTAPEVNVILMAVSNCGDASAAADEACGAMLKALELVE